MSNQDKSTDVFKAWFAQTWLNDSLATDFYYIFFIILLQFILLQGKRNQKLCEK